MRVVEGGKGASDNGRHKDMIETAEMHDSCADVMNKGGRGEAGSGGVGNDADAARGAEQAVSAVVVAKGTAGLRM